MASPGPPDLGALDALVDRRDEVYMVRDGEELLVRLYLPAAGGAARRAVVDVHGGAWCDNDRRFGKAYCMQIAASGAVVAAIDFRCGPRYRHPCASADVAAAVRWVRANASRLDVDAGRIVSVGSSSGGHLALLAALRPDADEHREAVVRVDGVDVDVSGLDASVRAVAALWPPTDPIARYRYASSLGTEHGERLVTNTEAYFGDEATMAAASAARVVRDGEATHHPDVWLVEPQTDRNVPTAIFDDLQRAYASVGRLRRTTYPGVNHAFGHFEGPVADRFRAELSRWVQAAA